MKTDRGKYKTIFISAGIAVLFLFVAYLAVFGRALRQEEDHIGIALALPRAIFNSEAVRVNNETYLSKDTSSFIETMEQQGFVYVEQMGAGHFFRKDGNDYISLSRMYSSHFMVFTHPIKN